jgi:hypothetical protein
MNMTCLEQAFRRDSGPLLFLVGVCMTLAWPFFWIDSGAGWTFLAASGSAVTVFCLVGARGGCGVATKRGRFVVAGRIRQA